MPFRALLKELVASVEGATGAIILEDDGEALQWHAEDDGELLRLRGAYLAVVMQFCRASAARLKLGDTGYFVVEYEGATFVIQELESGYFVALELNPSANIGQAIYCLQPAVVNLRRAMAA